MTKTFLNYLEQSYELLCSLEISGQPYSLKNRQIINCRGKYPRIIKSKEASDYLNSFSLQVPDEYKDLRLGSLDAPLAVIVVIYYRSRRPDLDVHAVMDGLQASGVIQNDRYIREVHSYALQDKENPRAEIYLFQIPKTQIAHPAKKGQHGTL